MLIKFTAVDFTILLVVIGMWCITDGWFSLSLYLKDKSQTWKKDHYIRVIRIIAGIVLLYMAYYFAKAML